MRNIDCKIKLVVKCLVSNCRDNEEPIYAAQKLKFENIFQIKWKN